MFMSVSPVSAANLDFNRTCAFAVEAKYNGAAILDLPITLYKAAGLETSGAGVTYTPTDDFSQSGADMSGISEPLQNQRAALTLLGYAESLSITGASTVTDSTGYALFSRLTPGLYLIAPGSAAGFYDIKPYLIQIPQFIDGYWNYKIIAVPKMEPLPDSTPAPSRPTVFPKPPPAVPHTPSVSAEPSPMDSPAPEISIPAATGAISDPAQPSPDAITHIRKRPPMHSPDNTLKMDGPNDYIEYDPNGMPLGKWLYNADTGSWDFTGFPPLGDLPQTGMLNWPIPVMSVSGLILFTAGWIVVIKDREGKKRASRDKD